MPEVDNLRVQRGHLGVLGCVNRLLAYNTLLET